MIHIDNISNRDREILTAGADSSKACSERERLSECSADAGADVCCICTCRPLGCHDQSAVAAERVPGDRYGWNRIHHRAPLGDGKREPDARAAHRGG